MVDHEMENFRLGRISIYIKVDLASKSFKHVALIACIVTVTMKQ